MSKDASVVMTPQIEKRIHSIDTLRGLIILLMTLDHVRDFWFQSTVNPTHLTQASFGLFMTRFMTHICAPMFIFLAGTGVFLSLSRGKSKLQMSKQLILRGSLLIFIEGLYLSKVWTATSSVVLLQVFWALGVSMIVLAFLIWLPKKVVFAFAMVQILGHNLFDSLSFGTASRQGILFALLHNAHTTFPVDGIQVIILYPLIPWLGVMALGFLFGHIMVMEKHQRIHMIRFSAWTCLFAFVALRLLNTYGDPVTWQVMSRVEMTFASFLNVEKYPPSLQFLLLTIGMGLSLLSVFERLEWLVFKPLSQFGGVALVYYLIHLPVIMGLLTLRQMISGGYFNGYGLLGVYGIWGLVMVIMYPICRGYGYLKAHKNWRWLKYF